MISISPIFVGSHYFVATGVEFLMTSKHSVYKYTVLHVGICVVVLSGILSCSSAKAPKNDAVIPGMHTQTEPVFPVAGELIAKRLGGGIVNFDYEAKVKRDTNSTRFQILFHATDCYVVVRDMAFQSLDTIDAHIATGSSSERYEDDTVSISTKGQWLNYNAIEFDSLIFDVHLLSQKTWYHELHTVELIAKSDREKAAPMMNTFPDIDARTDSSIVFGVAAQRVRGALVDYFPSSEHIRLEVLDEAGRVVYNSSDGAQFLQQVTPVEPIKKGIVQRYTITWLGTNSKGEAVPDGKYVAKLSIMAKPMAYTSTVPFEWKGRAHDK